MKISPGIGQEPSLQRLVIASLILHFVLMVFLFTPFKTREREFKNYYVSLVEPARVSGGGEPAARNAVEKPVMKKEVPKEKKTADKTAETKKKDDDKMALKDKKIREIEAKRKDAETVAKEIERLKAIAELSKKRAERDKTGEIDVVRKGIQESSAKGGGAGKGGQTASESDCPYCTVITEKIWGEWIYPDFDSANIEVVISIKIDSKGKVVYSKIDKPSGNKLFNDSALKAISKASPLPPPPPFLEMEEIVVRFHL